MSDNLRPPTLDVLCDELRQVVEWDQVALYLKVYHVDIKGIEAQYSGLAQRKMHSLQKWLDQTNTVHSWRTVADAIGKVNPAVAERIRAKYVTILDQVLTTSQNEEHSIVSDGQYPTSSHDPIINDHRLIALEQVPSSSANDDRYPTSNSRIEEEEPLPFEKEIVEQITNLEDRFAMLVAETQQTLEKRPNEILLFFRYLKVRLRDEASLPNEAEITCNKLFDILNDHWNYLNCLLLQRIVQNFLSDTELPAKVQKYQEDLAAFQESTKMKSLVDKIKSKQTSTGNIQIALKVKKMWLDVSLKHFNFLVKLLFQEYDKSLQNIAVTLGCMHVIWTVSKDIASLIKRAKYSSEELKAVGVISLTVGKHIIFHCEDSQDDMTFDTALLKAVHCGNSVSAISLLLEVGSNFNLLTQSGETVISALSEIKNDNCATILYVASLYGHSSVVSILLNNGADPNIFINNGRTPLMAASGNGHGDVVELFLGNSVPVNNQSIDGMTAIYVASQNGHSSVVLTLLNNGADPNITTNDGWTPLMIASHRGYGDVVELLLEQNVPVNTQSTSGITAIYVASQNGHSSVVSTLLNNGANPNIDKIDGRTPLMIASENGHGDIVELLIYKNVPVNTQSTSGITAIYFASQNGHSSIVSALLNSGADPNIVKNDRWTPLMIASQKGHGDVVKLLLKKNVPVNTQIVDGMTAIYIASQNGHFSVVSALLNNGADPNIAKNNGWTPLLIASQKGHGDVVELLLESKISVNTQITDGMTAICSGSQNGNSSTVSFLHNNWADPNLADNDGWTALIVASQNGYVDVVKLLLNKSVSINTQTKEGATAIYIASQNGHLPIVSILLSKGGDPNLARTNGWTPLIIASARGHDDVVGELLKTQINVNQHTPTGTTALHFSSYYGHENIVRQLLEGGANPLIRDTSGQTPQDVAYQKGHHNIVLLLQDAMAGFHDDDQGSLAGSIESGYTTGGLSTDDSSVVDYDIAQISDLEEDIMETTSFSIVWKLQVSHIRINQQKLIRNCALTALYYPFVL